MTRVVVGVMGLLAIGPGCGNGRRAEAPSSPRTGPQIEAVSLSLIQTVPVITRVFTNRVPWQGVVESQSTVSLQAPIAARIERIEVPDQAPVENGELLIQLGGVQVESELDRLQDAVESLNEEHVLATQAVERLEVELREALATRDQVAAARQSAIELQSRFHRARVALDSYQDQIRIAAPMAGVFTGRRVQIGQRVEAGDRLAEVLDARHLRVAASLFPPSDCALVGKPIVVRLGDGQTLAGTIQSVLPEASRAGATVAWMEGPAIDRQLHPGQGVAGSIVVAADRAMPAVPEAAIVYDDREDAFAFVQHEGAYQRRPVEVGQTNDGWVEILSGLQPGQQVVTRGAYQLFYSEFGEQFKVQD